MGSENVFQMFARMGSAGYFVRRNSWSERSAARIVSVGGMTEGVLRGEPPYYADPTTKRSPVVLAEISYQGAAPKLDELSSPGTFAYTMIDRPTWWPGS